MKKLIAIIISLFIVPIPAAQANSYYQLLTPVLTTTYELPAQTYNSRWRTIEIPFSVILKSDGSVSSVHFDLIDAEGYKLDENEIINPLNFTLDYKNPITWTTNTEWTLYSFHKAKLPITLRVEVEFWRSTGKASIIQTFPMNFVTHKDDILEQQQKEAEEKARAQAVAEALEKAKAEELARAEAKAKAEAQAKALAEELARLKAEQEKAALAKAKAEAEARERQIKINNQNYIIDLYSGIRCSKRGKYMIVSEITFKCVKKGKKLVWKVQ